VLGAGGGRVVAVAGARCPVPGARWAVGGGRWAIVQPLVPPFAPRAWGGGAALLGARAVCTASV
jgi:hypothetical protein